MLDESREMAHILEYPTKLRAISKYDSKVNPREMMEEDLVLKRPIAPMKGRKLSPN
jgi:hypothetical protein